MGALVAPEEDRGTGDRIRQTVTAIERRDKELGKSSDKRVATTQPAAAGDAARPDRWPPHQAATKGESL